MSARTREMASGPRKDKLGQQYYIYDGVTVSTPPPTYSPLYVPHRVITTDEIHPRHPYEGGPFSSRSYDISFADGTGAHGNPVDVRAGLKTDYSYKGKYRANISLGSVSVPSNLDEYTKSFGARAWAKYNPTKPIVSASVFLAELRDFGPKALVAQLTDLRSLFRNICTPAQLNTRTGWLQLLTDMQNPKRGLKNLSKIYLAYQFGWKPFLKDVRSFLDSMVNIDKKVYHLIRNNGRWQRKGGTLFETTNSSSSGVYPGLIPSPAYYTSYGGSTTTITEEKCWFKGSFRYYIPELNDPKWGRLKAARVLYDLTIGPEQFYKLFPFTWMFDWFGRFGDVVTNMQSQLYNQLTAKYAYIMLHRKVKVDTVTNYVTFTQKFSGERTFYKVDARSSVTSEVKTRSAASPFGFNLVPADMDPWKLSILSALGISKLRF